jgi:hypothetical protein
MTPAFFQIYKPWTASHRRVFEPNTVSAVELALDSDNPTSLNQVRRLAGPARPWGAAGAVDGSGLGHCYG